MDPKEVRAIRGSLSRAAFAKLLGVTSLTVLRWELADGSKEARRPRAKMIDSLRQLALEGGAPHTAASIALDPGLALDDEEDDGASEPRAPESAQPWPSTSSSAPPAFQADERLVLPLIEQLGYEGWARAEDELLTLLSSRGLSSHAGRSLATLGLAQARFFGRFDVRAALTALLPVLTDVERGELPRTVAARTHVMAALVYGGPDSRFFDVGRVNVHAERAEPLLEKEERELRCLLGCARVLSCRFMGPATVLRTFNANLAALDGCTSPLTRFIVERLRGLAAVLRGDDELAARHSNAGYAIGERMGLKAMMVAVLADRAGRMLRGAHTPPQILELTTRAREVAKSNELAANEPLIRVYATECEALGRMGRFAEAAQLGAEALDLAERSSVALYPMAAPLARVFAFSNRTAELSALAERLEHDSAAGQGARGVHAILVRGALAGVAGDFQAEAEILEQICSAPDSTPGLDYVVHDAHVQLFAARVLQRADSLVPLAQQRAERMLEQRPSVWHAAHIRRVAGFALMSSGHLAEARQKLESTVATFALLEDIVQIALAQVALAVVARASGAPDGAQRFEAAARRLAELGVVTPALRQRAQVLSAPPAAVPWQEQTITERLVIAVERLSVAGLSQEQRRRELISIIQNLLPDRELTWDVGSAGTVEERVEIDDGKGDRLSFRVASELGPAERAALRILTLVTPLLAVDSLSGASRELQLDAVQPGFIAVASATRQLKTEVSRLSRSSATVLITGESGSGKEVVARAVHDLSVRADKPYIVFNCASVPRDLFESQLFGHRRGAFTGATNDSPGVIRAADGGTLFLDEVGELPLDTQPKLLRFLENSEVLALGEQKARRVDVRIVAATHRDLGRLVLEGRFREDLYYRLNVVPLHVAPLRQRQEDVLALARLFLTRLTPEGDHPPELASDAIALLTRHTWPGNVRELRNVIERAMAYTPIPGLLRAEHLRIATN